MRAGRRGATSRTRAERDTGRRVGRGLVLPPAAAILGAWAVGAPFQAGPSFEEIAAGADHACGRTSTGQLYCWGSSVWGQLGDGERTARDDTPAFGPRAFGPVGEVLRIDPVPVESSLRFRAVMAGARHTCALTEEGEAYCWGMGRFGQLGTGTDRDAAVPTPVAEGLRFVQLSAGGTHTCGIASSGKGYCWGGNWHGQLGDGTLRSRNAPVPVRAEGPLRAIGAGGTHTCAVTEEGAALCWGDRRGGRLGTGRDEPADRTLPARVAGELVWEEVHAGGAHTCGVTSGRRLHCWGRDAEGQLGTDGEAERALGPAPAALEPPVAEVAAGPNHTCARSAEGAWCWGEGTRSYTRGAGEADPRAPHEVDLGSRMRPAWPRRSSGSMPCSPAALRSRPSRGSPRGSCAEASWRGPAATA